MGTTPNNVLLYRIFFQITSKESEKVHKKVISSIDIECIRTVFVLYVFFLMKDKVIFNQISL